MDKKLFSTDLPELKWTEFSAEGFAEPVAGVIYRAAHPADCGMPLGGIDTGCIDLETNGTFGYCSIFNSHVPRRGPLHLPFLGMAIGKKVWTFTTQKLPGVDCAKEIHYWGHYPIADLEYELDAPVTVGLRAFSPFVPGDTAVSNTPGAFFEVQLRNTSSAHQNGTVAFSFPGPLISEADVGILSKRELKEEGLIGVMVGGEKGSGNAHCIIAVMGEEKVRCGRELGEEGTAWLNIGSSLSEQIPTVGGASVAVDFSLKSGEVKTVRFLLAWYSPVWRGSGNDRNRCGGNSYTHMYASRFKDALEVAKFLTENHGSLLRRILAWQQVIYTEKMLPTWLKDSLINMLHLITEDSLWAQAKPPIGDWCKKEDGLFGMNESPRLCPQIECIPCSFYGNLPLVYFFPELALSTLRGYKAYMYPEGAAPWIFGGFTGGTGGCEMTLPVRGYQTTLNGPCFVDMVDRYWMRTKDDEFLWEFYPYVKKNTIFTMNLRGDDPDGVISMPTGNVDTEWFESCEWAGMVAHVGGIHLANLRMTERMAEKVGDKEFAQKCRDWLRQGISSMENKMWAGEYYLNFYEPETEKKSDLVMAYQLDGEWMAKFHGLEGVFQPDRVNIALSTIKRACVPHTKFGVVNFANPDGSLAADTVGYGSYGLFVAEIFMLAMTYMYNGKKEFGLELARRCMDNIVCKQRLTWNMPCIMDGDTGVLYNGDDYYQAMMLWSLPAVLQDKDLSGPCAPEGLVDRVILAGKEK